MKITLDLVLDTNLRNAWLYMPKMKVYVRVGQRAVNGTLVKTFQVANVEVKAKYRRQGVFTTWLAELEQRLKSTDVEYVMVEGVLNPELDKILERRNYVLDTQHDMHDYYKKVTR